MAAKYAIVILAAGSSSRLGQPKQLLGFNGSSLLQKAINEANAAAIGTVLLVLGANASTIHAAIDATGVTIIENPSWQQGMGSSISYAATYLTNKLPAVEGAIFTVCDQPFITAALFREMVTAHENEKKPIVACDYGNAVGTPAFFAKKFFAELGALKGDKGAKQLIGKFPDEVELVNFPKGTIDIDTETDYERLLQN
jgi:molybdenum cofactor cytidylyltransferase